jgi:lipooligosaccharide transport system permease protein
MSVSLPHALSVWWRNASMYRRTWTVNLLPNFFEPVFYLTAMGIGVGAYIQEMGGVSYVQFLVPGLVCVAAMNGASYEATYNVFVRLNFERTYDAMLTAPVEPDDVLFGEVLWALTRAAIYGGAFLAVASAFGYVPLPRALTVLAVVPLAGLLFASLGLVFTLRITKVDHMSFYFTLFLTPLFLFSGVFFPIEERLSGVWLAVAEALPLLHPVRLARDCFAGDFGLRSLWDLGYILAVSTALLALARSAVRRRLTA